MAEKKSRTQEPKTGAEGRQVSVARPGGTLPTAMVMARHGKMMVERRGRGFSLGELGGAGLGASVARRWGLAVDSTRRSVLEPNVALVRHWASGVTHVAKPARASVVRKDIEKVEEEVEKEVEVVKKVAKKAEKKAAKAAKEVVKEAEKARPRAKAKAKKKKED